MKKTIINENWEEELIEDTSYFYVVIYRNNVDKIKYVKLYSINDEFTKSVYEELKTQLKEAQDENICLFFAKVPKTKQTEELLAEALYSGSNVSPNTIEATEQLLDRVDLEILESYCPELTEAKKKKKRKPRKILGGYLTWTTGWPAYNMAMFNKHTDCNFTPSKEEKDAEKAAEKAAEAANDAIDSGSVSTNTGVPSSVVDSGNSANSSENSTNFSGESTGDAGDAGASGGEGGAIGESLELTEAKRYVKRYYVRPQNIFCSNKEEILKALVQVGDNNCSVYSLKSLTNHDDVHLLKPSDIIYYYDDGVLYDKNHVKVMDYDLFVKHEEERKKVGNVNAISDASFDKMYDDRLTDADLKDKEIKVRKPTHEELEEAITFDDLDAELWAGESIYLGYNNAYVDDIHNFADHGVYSDTSYYASYDEDTGIYSVTCWHNSDDGAEEEGETEEFNSREDFEKYVKALKLKDKQVQEALKEDTIYVGKIAQTLNLPPEIKLLTQAQVEDFVDSLEPEEEFIVGYVNPVYFYRDLWDLLPIYKCTEMSGYTGVDFANSADEINADKETRVADAKAQIQKAKETGNTMHVGADVNYRTQNKLVNMDNTANALKAKKAGFEMKNRNTILFYPTNILHVCYYVKLPTQSNFIKVTAEKLETYIYDNLPKIKQKIDHEKARAKVHNALYNLTPEIQYGNDVQSIDRSTRIGSDLSGKYIHKYDRDKLQVRALYTTQIYHLESSNGSYGHEITESIKKDLAEEAFEQNFKSINALGEDLDDVFTCCICGEETTGYGNNPEPVRHEGRCCDACNRKFVIPARIAMVQAERDKSEGEA